MKLIFSHPTGNSNVRAAVKGLHKENMIAEFHTAIASFEGTLLNRLSNTKFFSEIKRRQFDNSLKNITHLTPYKEICRLLAKKARLHSLVKHETGWCSIEAVNGAIDKKVARRIYQIKNEIAGVYAYEDEALLSFRQAKQLGLACIYDLPAAYWGRVKELMQKEKEKWPDWLNTMNNFADSDAKLERKDEEIGLADCIIVASTFTANSLKNYPGQLSNIKIVPYGFPVVSEDREYRSFAQSRPLKVLYVGKLSQQKGIANLFTAVERLKNKVELTIVGGRVNNLDCKALDAELNKHKWIQSLSHSEVLRIMKVHDVLVFPSISDGFGLVISEAMSQGTPVIASDHTAGPDLITHGYNGWLCKAGSTSSLKENIEALLSNPSCLAIAGMEAMKTARQRPWMKYGEDLTVTVKKCLYK